MVWFTWHAGVEALGFGSWGAPGSKAHLVFGATSFLVRILATADRLSFGGERQEWMPGTEVFGCCLMTSVLVPFLILVPCYLVPPLF